MRLLVTGGAGFIGSHLVRQLLSDAYPAYAGAEVTVFDKLTYAGNLANLAPVSGSARYRFVHGDICDAALLREVMPGHDAVVNLAAESHVDRSIAGAADFVVTNVLGAQTVFDAALRTGVPRVLHVSTDEVYGSTLQGSFAEGDRLDPSSSYSASKAAADLLARACAVTHGLDVVVTRGPNTYGPYQYPEKIVPLFTTNLLDGEKVPLYGDGQHVREWLHVDDHCRALVTVLQRGRAGEVYNVGGGTELTNRALTDRLLAVTGRDRSFVEHVEDRSGHDRRYSVDGTRTAALGYAPQHDLESGLAEVVQWYRDHEDWWRPLKEKAALRP